MNNQIKDIADRIKDLREFSDYTVEEFAKKANIPYEDYLDIESGKTDISIGKLYNIAAALMIDPTVLLNGENSTAREIQVVYEGNGMKVDRYDGYSFVSLAHKFIGRKMEPMIVTLRGGIAPELVQHTGQEFNYVLKGKIRLLIGSKEYFLRAGDCAYFDPTIPHAQVSMEEESRFLTIILEE